jgi:uncharacterized protein YdhG (YjbR/CyaY superfamily)
VASGDSRAVDDYIARYPPKQRAVLRGVRRIIRKALPEAGEAIGYGIPAFKLYGSYVVYLAGWKQHFSLYPATDTLVAALKGQLAPYRVRKGTIRFLWSDPIPEKLIERIAKGLAREAAARAEARRTRAAKPRSRARAGGR